MLAQACLLVPRARLQCVLQPLEINADSLGEKNAADAHRCLYIQSTKAIGLNKLQRRHLGDVQIPRIHIHQCHATSHRLSYKDSGNIIHRHNKLPGQNSSIRTHMCRTECFARARSQSYFGPIGTNQTTGVKKKLGSGRCLRTPGGGPAQSLESWATIRTKMMETTQFCPSFPPHHFPPPVPFQRSWRNSVHGWSNFTARGWKIAAGLLDPPGFGSNFLQQRPSWDSACV